MYGVMFVWTSEGVLDTEAGLYFCDTYDEAKDKLKEIVDEFMSLVGKTDSNDSQYLEKVVRYLDENKAELYDEDKAQGLIAQVINICKQKEEGSVYMSF